MEEFARKYAEHMVKLTDALDTCRANGQYIEEWAKDIPASQREQMLKNFDEAYVALFGADKLTLPFYAS
jgi:hypothetical protein